MARAKKPSQLYFEAVCAVRRGQPWSEAEDVEFSRLLLLEQRPRRLRSEPNYLADHEEMVASMCDY